MQTTERKISELIPAEYNPRQLSDKQHEDLKASLTRFGAVDPAIVNIHPDRKDIIVGGHQRLKVAKSLGWETFPCVEVNLTRDQERELNVRLNKNTGSWDWNILGDLFQAEELKEWGFSDEELFGNIEVEESEAQEDNYEIPDEIETDIVLGDLIEIGEHRLLCGDSTDSDQVAKLMNGEKADMVFTDPPYGVEYKGINNDTREGLEDLLTAAFGNYITNSEQGASVYCFHSDRSADIFHSVFRSFCHFSSMIIWVKESIVLSQTDYQSKHESCLYGWFDNGTHSWYSDRKQESVWLAKSKREEGHTTPKPIEIVSKALNNSSLPNHLIFDLFLGSGSTMVAAHQLNRKCYGMELDPKYCQVIIDRMLKLDPSLQVKINGE